MDARDFVLWCILAWLWGSSFLAIGIGVETLSPFSLVAARMVVGAIVLAAFVYLRGSNFRMGARGWIIAAIVGVSGNVIPFVLISFAEQRVDSGLAALIMGIAPVVTLSVAPFIDADDKLGVRKAVGAAAGFAGVIVLVGPSALEGLGGNLIPQLALIAAALCYSFTALFSRRFPYSDPLRMAAASVLVGAVVTCAIAGMKQVGTPFPVPSFASIMAVIYLGIGPTALAALIYFQLIPRIGASRLQQVNYVVPVLGTLLGMIFLAEKPGWNALIAIPLIIVAVYAVSSKPGNRSRPPAQQRR